MTDAVDERAAELETLETICGDSFITGSEYSGSIEAPAVLHIPLEQPCADKGGEDCSIAHLLSESLLFDLPEDYPENTAPRTQLRASWLPDHIARTLEIEVLLMWEGYGRMPVMYAWKKLLSRCLEWITSVQSEISRTFCSNTIGMQSKRPLRRVHTSVAFLLALRKATCVMR